MIAGVGHVESAARGLEPVADALRERAAAGRPLLGICVGMQLLFEESEEGGRGLGLLEGRCGACARAGCRTWAGTSSRSRGRPTLLDGLDGADVYFAHSYAVEPAGEPSSSPRSSTTGTVVAAVESGPLAGVQFHPERSGAAGRAPARERAAMVKKRVIPCLDVAGGRVVKGVRFETLRDVGDPVELATRYSELGADELVFLDITATLEGRGPMLELVERAAEQLTIPFTVGGGVSGLEDARALLRAGADKVAVNRAAVDDPALLDGARGGVRRAGGRLRDRRARRGGRHARRPDAARARRRRVGGRGGRARRGRDPAHLDRRRRDARRLRPRADAARSPTAVAVPVIASGGAGRGAPPRRGVRGRRRGGAGRLDRARAARAAAAS